MRIAFFAWEYPPVVVGGLGTYATYITRKFVEMGHDVCVFSLNRGDLPTREIIQGVEVHRPLIADASRVFPLLSPDLGSWGENLDFFSDFFIYNVLSASKLSNYLVKKEKCEFDMVCYHDWLNSIAGIMTNEQLDVPTAFHAHSTEWGRTGNGSQIIKSLEREAAASADGTITVSHAMKEDLARHGWPGDTFAVWNGVDPGKYDPNSISEQDVLGLRDRYGIHENENMVLFVGRLTWVKGVRNLIQAMPHVLSENPNTKLVILGQGEQQWEITDLASALNISDRMYYRFEFVPEDERILHYAAADMCVFPSIYEPFGIVSLEAMSMETPPVVGAKGLVGFREQVISSGPDQCGIHVDGNNPGDIAWGINQVLSNPDRAREWGRNARKRVMKHFTWDDAANNTMGCYQAIRERAGYT